MLWCLTYIYIILATLQCLYSYILLKEIAKRKYSLYIWSHVRHFHCSSFLVTEEKFHLVMFLYSVKNFFELFLIIWVPGNKFSISVCLKLSLFCFHFWRIFSLNMEFFVVSADYGGHSIVCASIASHGKSVVTF